MPWKPVHTIVSTDPTRFAPFPYYYQPDPKLWQYFIINSEVFGVDWRTTAEEGVYEQVIVRQGNSPGYQGFFYTVPDDDEYFTKDLYRPHPTLLNHWSYHGRADDIIVFSNGEKLNPVTIEQIVGDHPQVKGALVVGSNKYVEYCSGIIKSLPPHEFKTSRRFFAGESKSN